MIASESATETVWLVAKEQSKYWKTVDPKSCEPQEGKSSVHSSYIQGPIRVLGLEQITFSIPGRELSSFPLYESNT